MPHKFKKGDPVFHKGEGYETIKGFYIVTEVGRDGDIYRVTDSQGEYTDADEDELEPVQYCVFRRVEHGWPIIIPVYDEPLMNSYINSTLYSKETWIGTAHECIEKQKEIWKELESASH